ncbi:MAG: hypothetical protein CMP10_09310 [Zetaproteobacteria bacterium]|nr:hypothetical protein [Pseudobdellovibrionaceae bacterium]|tara:strand:- start:1469 stop:2104 length:636 start_codon:yes stop_codon:yes gene_type:complete
MKNLTIMLTMLFIGTKAYSENNIKIRTVTLEEGESVVLDNEQLQLTLTELVDSRCPADMQCIWQGEAKAKIAVSENEHDQSIFEIKFPGKSEEIEFFNGYVIRVISILPYPVSEHAEQPRITLQVIKNRKLECNHIRNRVCVMDYQPTSCAWRGLVVEGPNSCMSRTKLEYQACLGGSSFDENDISCQQIESMTPLKANNNKSEAFESQIQ